MHLLLQYLVAKKIADNMTEQQRQDALRVIAPMAAKNLVGGLGVHPLLGSMLTRVVSERIQGRPGNLSDDDLRRMAGNYVAREWVSSNFPDLGPDARSQLTNAIVRARGW